MKFGIGGSIEQFLAARGFSLVKKMDADDCRKAYFHGKNADRIVSGRAHFAYAVVA